MTIIPASWPDWLRAGIRTSVQTFIAVFGLALVGWFADLQDWAGDGDGVFPAITPLGKAFAAAVAAAASGLVAAVMNALGKNSAAYPPPPGQITTMTSETTTTKDTPKKS